MFLSLSITILVLEIQLIHPFYDESIPHWKTVQTETTALEH